jgi:hypothetical protein
MLQVIVLLVILVMRKRIKLVTQLFKEAGRAINSMPLLLLEPLLVSVHDPCPSYSLQDPFLKGTFSWSSKREV